MKQKRAFERIYCLNKYAKSPWVTKKPKSSFEKHPKMTICSSLFHKSYNSSSHANSHKKKMSWEFFSTVLLLLPWAKGVVMTPCFNEGTEGRWNILFFPHNRAPCTPEIPNKKQKKRRIKNHRHCLCRYFILRTLRLYLASTNISIIVLITIFLSIPLQYTIRIFFCWFSIAATDGIGCYVCTSMNGDNPYCDDPFNTTFPGIFLFYIYFSNKSTIFLHAKKKCGEIS